MQTAARRHHYIPEFYLNGFTESIKNKKYLHVFDLHKKKYFKPSPDNVAVVRDFNRLDLKDASPDVLELTISKLETKVAKIIKTINRVHSLPKNEDLELLYNFIALLACRNPIQREMKNNYISEISNRTLEMIYESKDCWESINKEMIKNGYDVDPNENFEKLKKIVDKGKLKWKASKNLNFNFDMTSIDAVLHTLHYRNWTIFVTDGMVNPFICSDNPVSLYWTKNINSQYSPGFAMKNTELIMPLNKSLVILGSFNYSLNTIKANKEIIAAINSRILNSANRFIFSSIKEFSYFGKNNEILSGEIFN